MIDLRCGKWQDGIGSLADGSVDFLFVDPPYGITRNEWDKPWDWGADWPKLWRVVKPDGVVAVCGVEPSIGKVIAASEPEFKYSWYWTDGMHSGHLNSHKMPIRVVEQVSVFYRLPGTYNPQMRPGAPYVAKQGRHSNNYGSHHVVTTTNNGVRYPTDLIRVNPDSPRLRGMMGEANPTMKPLGLLLYLIRTYTNPGELVVDPAFGTGTTALAATLTGRSFVGWERDTAQYNLAQRQLSEQVLV